MTSDMPMSQKTPVFSNPGDIIWGSCRDWMGVLLYHCMSYSQHVRIQPIDMASLLGATLNYRTPMSTVKDLLQRLLRGSGALSK